MRECPCGVIVKAMDGEIVAREFELKSRYYVHFRINTLGKGMNPFIPPVMNKMVLQRLFYKKDFGIK